MIDIPEDVRKLADAMQKQSVIDGIEISRLRGELASANAQIDILKDILADREKRGEPVAWIAQTRWEQMACADDWVMTAVDSKDQSDLFACVPLYASAPPAPQPVDVDAVRIAEALEACDWSNTPIGNKAIIQAAIRALKGGA